MQDVREKWALVTGASGGLGAEFARQLAQRGAHVVLVARQAEPMQALARTLQERFGTRTVVEALDLSAVSAVEQLKTKLDEAGIAVDVLINNAGFGVFGEFVDQPLTRIDAMLKLNVLTLTALTHVFAADMVRRRSGYILLTASIGAFQATPLYAAYSASKAYVLLLGEALHEELRPRGVTVTVLSPGVTATGFFGVAGQTPTPYQRLLMMSPEAVVGIGLDALMRGRASVVSGRTNACIAWCNRLVPRWLQRKLAQRLMSR